MKRWMIVGISMLLGAGSASAVTVTFTGADTGNNLFSNTNNWDVFPSAADKLNMAPTSFGDPGQLDAAFNVAFGNAYVLPNANGTAYIEVLSGAVWKSGSLTIGHGNTGFTTRPGVLTLKSGSSLTPTAGNTSTLTIGTGAGGSQARLAAEDGLVDFSYANLLLKATGTLAFQFGTNSVSTFVSTKSNGAATMLLDGTVELDLGALNTVGTYTLFTGSDTNTVLSGALITWLDSNGGSVSGDWNLDTDHFDVVNPSGVEWSLTTAASGTELVLTVTGFDGVEPPILERSLAASQDVGVRSAAANNQADVGRAGAILLNDSSTRGLLEFDLSAAEYEITNAVLKLTQIANLTGSWELSIYPLVYTADNYNWYEGTGTVLWATNEDSPATNANAACYLYSRDDVSSPVQWEDSAGTPMANIAQAAVWNSPIATVSSSNSVAGNQIVFNLDVAELEKMRTNGVQRIALGIWGTTSLSGNYFLATKDNVEPDYHPVLDLQMKTPPQAPVPPVITGINVESIAAGNRVEVSFVPEVMSSLWFSPDLIVPAWTNVAFGSSPLLHTNNVTPGFYKVSASE